MRKQLKRLVTLGMVACLSVSSSMMVFAGQWKETGSQWKYQNDDGTYATSGWQWIDGNNDGVSECYYFNADGVMLANTITPDGYSVNDSGAWVIDGVVQIQSVATSADDGSNKLKTDLIKQEFIDCYGKDTDYIINAFGEPKIPPYVVKISDGKIVIESHTLIYEDMIVKVRDNKVQDIWSKNKYELFNTKYSTEELDNLLDAKTEGKDYGYTWQLDDTPFIKLWYSGDTDTSLSFEYE